MVTANPLLNVYYIFGLEYLSYSLHLFTLNQVQWIITFGLGTVLLNRGYENTTLKDRHRYR